MTVKQEPSSWESIVLAGDGSTWHAGDWVWDPSSLTARPKQEQQQQRRYSARRDSAGTAAVADGKLVARPCAAAARLASHLHPDSPGSTDCWEAPQRGQHAGVTAAAAAAASGGADPGLKGRAPGESSRLAQGQGPGAGKAQPRSKALLANRRTVCQADGCNRDLSTLTYYHQRNRICEMHIRADAFSRDGEQLRFCQRCGHSHPLADFDPGKHSCRKQLERHNARRRKASGKATAPSEPAGRAGAQQKVTGKLTGSLEQREQTADPSPCISSNNPGQADAGGAAGPPKAPSGTQPAWFHMDSTMLPAPAAAAADQEHAGEGAASTTPAAAPGAALSRAQQRLAARIARLAAAGANVAPLLAQAEPPAAPHLPLPGLPQASCCCKASQLLPLLPEDGQAAAWPTPSVVPTGGPQPASAAAPHSLPPASASARLDAMDPPPLAALATEGAAASPGGSPRGALGGSEPAGPARSDSPLLPLLDFDLDLLEGGLAGQGAVAPCCSSLADDLSEWISAQLADHAVLCEPGTVQQAQHAQQLLEEEDPGLLQSLLEDIEAPSPAAAQHAEGAAVPAAWQSPGAAPFQPVSPLPSGYIHHSTASYPLAADHPAAQQAAHLPSLPSHSSNPSLPQQQPMGASSYALASGLVAPGGPAALPPPDPLATLTKVSVKLFGCTPNELPSDLRQQVSGWLGGSVAGLDGYIRPGCVHLTVQAIVHPGAQQQQQGGGREHDTVATAAAQDDRSVAAQQGGARGASETAGSPEGQAADGANNSAAGGGTDQLQLSVESVLDSMQRSGCELWRRKTLLVQCDGQLGLVHHGRLRRSWDVRTAAAARAVPQVLSVSPPLLVAGRPAAVQLAGVNLMQNDCQLLARMHGAYLDLPEAGCAHCCCRAPRPTPSPAHSGGQEGGAAAGSGPPGGGGPCCVSSSGEEEGEGEAAGWEQRCCGCCTSKLRPGPQGGGGAGGRAGVQAGAGSSGENQASTGRPEGELTPLAAAAVAGHEQQQQQGGPHVQSVRAVLPGSLATGLLYLDVQRGAFSAPQGARLVVVDSEAVQQEVWRLPARLAPQHFSSLLDQLGMVYEWQGSPHPASRPELGLVQHTTARLLCWCATSGLVATADALLRMLARTVPSGLPGALELVQRLACEDGLSLLHRALQSRSLPMVQAVLGWGEEAGMPWPSNLPGPLSLTPLHLAAAIPDAPLAAGMLEQLLQRCAGGAVAGAAAWGSAQTADGLTAAQFAGLSGVAAVMGELLARLAPQQVTAAGRTTEGGAPGGEAGGAISDDVGDQVVGEADRGIGGKPPEEADPESSVSVQQPATPRRCRCTGDCPCARARERCAWCQQEDDGRLGDTASSGAGACGKACGLDGGRCGCCGAASNGSGGDADEPGSGGSGSGLDRGSEGKDGGGGSGGGLGGDPSASAGNAHRGCCGGAGRGGAAQGPGSSGGGAGSYSKPTGSQALLGQAGKGGCLEEATAAGR
ncbi:hypothetical protein N2152v2_004669 [Parachlorella kessleri]